MNQTKTFKKLFELHKAIMHIKVGVEASRADVIRLFDLLDKKRLEAFAIALKGIMIRPKNPVHFIYKPYMFDTRPGMGDMQAECGVSLYDKAYKNIYYRTYEAAQLLQMGGRVVILPTIYDEVFFFQNKVQSERYLNWAQKHDKIAYAKVSANCVVGKVELQARLRKLLDKYVGPHIKGFKMFRKKTYQVAESIRTISGTLLTGLIKYKKVNKATKMTLTKLKGWKPRYKRPRIENATSLKELRTVPIPTLDAVAVANLPQLSAEAV